VTSALLAAILRMMALLLAPNVLQDPFLTLKVPPLQLLVNNAPQARFLAALVLNLALGAMLVPILQLKALHLHLCARPANQAHIVALALHNALSVLKELIRQVLVQGHALLVTLDVILHKKVLIILESVSLVNKGSILLS